MASSSVQVLEDNKTKASSSKSVREVLKQRARQRKELLAESLGASSIDSLNEVLGNKSELESRSRSSNVDTVKVDEVASTSNNPPDPRPSTSSASSNRRQSSDDAPAAGVSTDLTATDFRGSQTFLKGTQSANPHNDYCQHFVDTGNRPQNFIRDSSLSDRFIEYPKLKELIELKDELVVSTATPPMYRQMNFLETDLSDIGLKFDVIIIQPPLEEYQSIGSTAATDFWTWDMIQQLNIPAVADYRCFVWLWCGSSPDGLAAGRQCLQSWGFRRCEDICWIKTNKDRSNETKRALEPHGLFQRTKEHCLMGIKGTVRRSVDGDFIHANVDIDLIISDEPPDHTRRDKAAEIFLVAEHFCLGRRRLHLFGRDDQIRPGWMTAGPDLTSTYFDARRYKSYFEKSPGLTTGCTDRIESLRPKSPPPKNAGGGSSGGRGGLSAQGSGQRGGRGDRSGPGGGRGDRSGPGGGRGDRIGPGGGRGDRSGPGGGRGDRSGPGGGRGDRSGPGGGRGDRGGGQPWKQHRRM